MEKLDFGKSKYMGRGILTGMTAQGDPVDIYFIEGRSPPSRKRKFNPPVGGIIHVDVNSETSIEEMIKEGGNPKLLLYDAMLGDPSGILIVSNGFQTNYDAVWSGEGREKEDLIDIAPGGIYGRVKNGMSMSDALRESLRQAGSEVDSIRTARIATARNIDKEPDLPVAGIIVRLRDSSGKMATADGLPSVYWDETKRLDKGEFLLFATYGVHDPPYDAGLPPDISEPSGFTRRIRLDGTNADQLVEEVWEAMPKDILVGVAAAMRDRAQPAGFRFARKNMKE